jgi:hypothetical protein
MLAADLKLIFDPLPLWQQPADAKMRMAFTGFGDATATSSYVIFRGIGTNQQGIYRSTTAGVLSRVADMTTIAPDGSGAHFTAFQDPSPR